MVIDEIQKAPELLSEIKLIVDNDFAGTFPDCNRRTVLEQAFCGGYPEAVALDNDDRRDWFQDYVHALFSKDIKDDEHIRRQRSLRDLLKAVAAWSSKFADSEKLMAACGLSRPTYTEYLNVLERYYLCERVEAWTGTDYARIGKWPKWYMCDTGLMSALLNWRIKDIELDPDKSGKFVETLVFTELAAQVDLSSEYSLYQYRDIDKREIDFIVENQDGDLAGIEVKAGSGVGKDDFKHLAWFRDNLAKGRKFAGIVVYTGRQTLSFGNGMLAVPISAFWS